MKQVPNVTLGMLTFNFGDGHLPDALSSILNQTYTNFNLIISVHLSVSGTIILTQSYQF